MKLRLSFLPLYAMLFIAAAFFASCTQTDTPPDTTYSDTYADISGLTVGTKYQFSVTSSNANTVISGVSSWNTGTVRVFWTRAAGDASKVTVNYPVGSTTGSNVIVWAPATGGGVFRVYETADVTVGHPSGLILGPTPGVLSIGDATAAAKIDVVLATDNTIPTPFISLIAPTVTGGVTGSTRETRFSTSTVAVTGGLAMHSLTTDFASQVSATRNYYDITPATHTGASEIVYAKTTDNHYSRIELIPQATSTFGGVSGNYLWGDTGGAGSRRFIDVNVTYQPTAGLGN